MSQKSKWKCNECKFLNHYNVSKCKMCGKQKKWICLLCTFVNPINASSCQMCGAPSPLTNDLSGKQICGSCTTINFINSHKCSVCGQSLNGKYIDTNYQDQKDDIIQFNIDSSSYDKNKTHLMTGGDIGYDIAQKHNNIKSISTKSKFKTNKKQINNTYNQLTKIYHDYVKEKGETPSNTFDLMNYIEYNNINYIHFNDVSQFLMNYAPKTSTQSQQEADDLLGNGIWQWLNGATWKNYDSFKNKSIEAVYKNGKNKYCFSFNGNPYEIRFKELKQYNINTNFARKVRRIQNDIPKKYISTKTKTTSVYCWEWKDDDGFKNYPQNISHQIESVYINKDKNGYNKTVTNKIATQTYIIKPFEMKQINKATQYERPIRRVDIKNINNNNNNNNNNNSVQNNSMKWQWLDNDGITWKDYDSVINDEIEKSYTISKKIHQFKVNGNKNYEIRFSTLKQCNLSTDFERNVRRIHVNKHGKHTMHGNNNNNNKIVNSASWTGPKRKTFGTEIMTLYHVTDKKAGGAIQKSGKMIRGSDGMFGGGIYFAETISSANYKSEHKGGCVIIAKVLVGKAFIAKDANTGKFDFHQLKSMGYDSVYAPNGSGGGESERVVYNWDQVCIVNVKQINN